MVTICFDHSLLRVTPSTDFLTSMTSSSISGHHIKLIEGVQRRFARMIRELKSLTYEARLKRLNLTTLEIRRIRGDLIEVYRILNGLEKIQIHCSQDLGTPTSDVIQ